MNIIDDFSKTTDLKRELNVILLLGALCVTFAEGTTAQWIQNPQTSRQTILSFTSNGSVLFAGASGGVRAVIDSFFDGGAFRSTDSGETWVAIDSGLTVGTTVYALVTVGSIVLAGTDQGVSTSSDSGSSWNMSNGGLPGWTSPSTGGWNRAVLSLLVIGRHVLAGTAGGGIYRSDDTGTTWSPHSLGLGGWLSTQVRTFGTRGPAVFAGTMGGNYVSHDSGSSWSLIASAANCFVSDGRNLFEGIDGAGVLRSSDNGVSWVRSNNLLSNDYVECLAWSGKSLLAGDFLGGVFQSSDSATTFVPINDGFGITESQSISVWSMILFDQHVVVGTSSGVWRRPLSEIVSSVAPGEDRLQSNFELHQNFPNPFNPSTKIQYALTERTRVKLSVFNVLGQHIATLVDRELDSGKHEATWDAGQCAGGVYIYTLQIGPQSKSKKMVLIR